MLSPVAPDVEPFEVSVPAADNAMSVAATLQDENDGDAAIAHTMTLSAGTSQSLTTTIAETQSFGASYEMTWSYSPPPITGGMSYSVTVSLAFDHSDTETQESTQTTTKSFEDSTEVDEGPNSAFTVTMLTTIGLIPCTTFQTTGVFYYPNRVRSSVLDEEKSAELAQTVYALTLTIKGIVQGGVSAGSTCDNVTTALSSSGGDG